MRVNERMNDTLRTMESRKRVWTWAAWGAMVLMPFLQLAVISLALGKNAFASYPVWSDELDYWRNLYNWLHVGFRTGYSGIGEYTPALGSLGVHGPTPLILYGGFCKVFGLTYHTISLCNALWISGGALTFCLLEKPKASVALIISGLFLVFVPAVLYAPTSMTELFNYGFLLFYFAFLLRYGRTKGKVSLMLCWVTVVFGCLYRITYLVLFVPLVWMMADRRFSWKLLWLGLLALVLSALTYVITALYTAPYPFGFLYNWLRAGDIRTFVQMFLSHAKSNLYDYFIRYTNSPMEDTLRQLYTLLMGLTLLGSFVRIKRKDKRFRLAFGIDQEMLGCFALLFIPFALVVMIYETNDWSDFRTLSPFLWGVAVVLMERGRKALPSLVLTGSVLMLVLLCTLPPIGAYSDEYRFEKQPDSVTVRQACQTLQYDPDAQNPFTNTIRADLASLQIMEEVPPGMGLMYGWFTPENTGTSRWILTDHLKIVVEGYETVFSKQGAKVYQLQNSYEQ